MGNAALLTLAGMCLGTALSGLVAVAVAKGQRHERLALGLIYGAFIGMIALPLINAFASATLVNYMPLLLVLLLTLPPAFHHYIKAKTTSPRPTRIPWRDLALPLIGGAVCVGYWILPTQDKQTMFIDGELPPGVLPSILAFATFALIVLWLLISFIYLMAILRHLTHYRTELRDLYSDADQRDLRWIDVMMVLIALIWATGAIFLADENFTDGALFVEEAFLALIGVGLLVLNVFAPMTAPKSDSESSEQDAPTDKYARSALTTDHAAKLATRIEAAMATDQLYLDPSLSLQKLSQHVGALPNQVSQTLNQEIGTTFFDYVAHWRIEASKPMISAGDASVLTVALDVGFNSRSTFYKAFSRETGMTPKGYRAAHQNAG